MDDIAQFEELHALLAAEEGAPEEEATDEEWEEGDELVDEDEDDADDADDSDDDLDEEEAAE